MLGAMDFDPLDEENVAANRLGKITPKQRLLLTTQEFSGCVVIPAAFIGIIFLCMATYAIFSVLQSSLSTPVVLLIVVGLVIPLAFIISQSRRQLRPLVTSWRLRRDVADGRVAQAPGEVVFSGGKYVILSPGRGLMRLLRGSNLTPGAYVFYYLARSGVVLSAQKLAARPEGEAVLTPPGPRAEPVVSKDPIVRDENPDRSIHSDEHSGFDLRTVLAKANGFPVLALEANRCGKMGHGQGAPLRREATSNALMGLAFGGLGGLVFVLSASDKGHPGELLFIRAVCGLFVAVGLYCLLCMWRIIADAMEGRVQMVEGKGGRARAGRNPTKYYYFVESMKFRVPRAAYDALIQDVIYRFYYAPRSKLMVGIEPVS